MIYCIVKNNFYICKNKTINLKQNEKNNEFII